MKIAKEGYPLIILFGLLAIVSILLNSLLGVWFWVLFLTLTIPLFGFMGFMIAFFRDPERHPESPYKEGISILSPADGSISAAEEENGNFAIYIQMHASNVHVTRAHLDGTVKKITRTGGKHYPIYFLKKTVGAESQAIRKNARVTIELEDAQNHPFTYQLVCGMVARRARPFVKEGETVKAGQKIGIIMFGSLTKVTLPGTQYRMIKKIGDNVFGGLSIICERI